MDRQTFKCELFETKQEHRLWLSFVDQGHWEIAERGPGYIATTCERSQGGAQPSLAGFRFPESLTPWAATNFWSVRKAKPPYRPPPFVTEIKFILPSPWYCDAREDR